MFEIGTKFWFGGRLFRIVNIMLQSKSFPAPDVMVTVQLDERRADGDWVYVGSFADITPDSLVDGSRTGEVEVIGENRKAVSY